MPDISNTTTEESMKKRYEYIETDLKASPGEGTIKRRKFDSGKFLAEFYAVNECTGDQCPIHLYCKFKKVKRQCQIQTKYLYAVNNYLFDNADIDSFTPAQLMKIGFHLQPLYRALCRLKMEELSLRRPTQLTNTGTRAIHPVYREIRETIKVITMTLKDLGFDGEKAKKEVAGYYEGLFGEEEEKPAMVRRVK